MSDAQTRITEITEATDDRLSQLSELLYATFADPDVVLGLDRMQEFLRANNAQAARRFCVLVAEEPETLIAGSVFSYVVRANCGFSEYLVVQRDMRRRGIGRRLFHARKAILDREARTRGHAGCRGLFIEVDNPDRVPPELAAAERETAMDTLERLRVFDHMGFRRVEVPYTQPPLADDKRPIDYLDLLFAPWQPAVADARRIPAEWVFQTVEVIWSAWSPQTYRRQLDALKRRVPAREIVLSSALPTAS